MPKVNKVHVYTATRQKGKSTEAAIDLTVALARASLGQSLLHLFHSAAAQQMFEASTLHNVGFEPLSFAQRRGLNEVKCASFNHLVSKLGNGVIVFVDDLPASYLQELIEGIECFSDIEAFVTVYTGKTDAEVGQ